MKYRVKITPFALSQLSETVKYISEFLLAPETAEKWLDTIRTAIASLSNSPNRFPLTEEEPWHTRGVRKFPVKGFIIYYLVNDKDKTATVTAVIYGRRDRISELKQSDN